VEVELEAAEVELEELNRDPWSRRDLAARSDRCICRIRGFMLEVGRWYRARMIGQTRSIVLIGL
jgi:hypothetical protein